MQGGILEGLLPFLLMIPVFYFLILRPRKQELKKTEEMLNALKKGDKVLTQAGIIGVVQSLEKDRIQIKIAENTKVEFSRSAVVKILEE